MKKIFIVTTMLILYSFNVFSQQKQPVPFVIADVPPMYLDFNKEEKEILKKWFNKKVSAFVNDNFDKSIANKLNLSGVQRVTISFKILTTGTIEIINIEAPHLDLEYEAIRVVEKLPKMMPGMYKGEYVDIKYSIPIAFKVE